MITDEVHMVTDNKVIITVTINIPPGFQNNPSPWIHQLH